MKTVHIAKTAGFCMGVALALKKLDQAIASKKDGQTIVTQGPIIHNPQILKYYREKGVFECRSLDEPGPQTIVVIRAHGIPLDVQQTIEKTGATLMDATCPKVKKAQTLIEKHAKEGRHLLLFGEKDHPEVKGLVSYAREGFTVFENMEELETILPTLAQPCFLVAQTTQDRAEFQAVKTRLLEALGELPVMDTICTATKQRQEEAIALAKEVDYLVVVGGKNSGNTRRLAQVASATGTPCCHVECKEELPLDDLIDCTTIGLTAGASTPEDVINEVYLHLRELDGPSLPDIPPLGIMNPSWKVPSADQCMKWWDTYAMIENIRLHSLAVTHVALSITRMALAHSPQVFAFDPTRSVEAAALLHDLAKAYCIYYGGNHAQVGASWVMALTGNPAIAQAVLHHISWPGKVDVKRHFLPLVVAYSDKRVRHDTIVSLDDRLEDLIHRYGETSARRTKIRTIFQQVTTIEHQLEQLTGVSLHAYSFDSRRLVS